MLPEKTQAFTGVLLTGGHSTRMGTDKALLRVGNELLIERQLRCLRESGANEVVISARAGAVYSGLEHRYVYDEQPDAGPLGGLSAALKSATTELLLVLAVDMPEMTSAMLRKIVSRSTDYLGCVPLCGDGYQPLAASYPKAALPLAGKHLAEREYSMREFVEAAAQDGLLKPLPIESSEQIVFTNWNRPADWSRMSL